ncbi:uncharacterized protein IUM83_13766 [Phytophthora cinnamomi]|uniref:uncharacterized protein n=1 Tax=Phytophthora cinnamomi TaxID=4785 RepID=UPI0035594C86|nr:hypothetical protein IUM83_13766 [Phytophthora cinnamomi]
MEEAVDRPTEIDDPMDNVAQGMINICQAGATAPRRYVIQMSGTIGDTNVIPGISGTGLPTEMIGGGSGDATVRLEVELVALFTNVYNAYSGTWFGQIALLRCVRSTAGLEVNSALAGSS